MTRAGLLALAALLATAPAAGAATQRSLSAVRRGDLLFLRIRPGLRASHLAIVRGRLPGNRVRAAEGDVSHTVALPTRSLSVPVLAARVTG